MMEHAEAAPQAKMEADGKQLLITLSGPDSEVVRVESLDRSGRKQTLRDEDLAILFGDHDVEDLFPVLEQAYMAGFSDASSDVFGSDDSEESEDDGELENAVARGVASRKLIRRGVRKLILARLLKRELLRKQALRPAPAVPVSETSH
ncbi:MAG TPA: hypothetical protein VFI23_10185 [Rhizomicrobium sp.]|nr:hypothetical protein [Rhizomicrobium sp.]